MCTHVYSIRAWVSGPSLALNSIHMTAEELCNCATRIAPVLCWLTRLMATTPLYWSTMDCMCASCTFKWERAHNVCNNVSVCMALKGMLCWFCTF